MTEEARVIKRFKSFILGKCQCGCKEDIPIRSSYYLRKRKQYHSMKGRNNHFWKHGLPTDGHGYNIILLPKHRFADDKGYVKLHRLVYELAFNCILLPWIDIHHIDKNKKNNSISNLRPLRHDYHSYVDKKINTDGRFCIECKSYETSKIKGKFCDIEQWYRHPITKEEWVCYKCFQKIYYRKSLLLK